MSLDLQFLERSADQLESEIQRRLKDILRILCKSLQDAVDTYSGALDSNGRVGRTQWVLQVKPRLASLVPEIEAWQRRFVDYVQLLRFTGSGFNNSKLRVANEPQGGSLTSPADRISASILLSRIAEVPPDAMPKLPPLTADGSNQFQSLDNPSVKTLLAHDSSSAGLLVECRKYADDAQADELEPLVRFIATILAAAGSDAQKTHVLQAVGYAQLPSPVREFQLFLKYPSGMDSPATLREILLRSNELPMASINARLDICRQAATAVFIMHTSGLVHKSIRPETFLLFQAARGRVTTPTAETDTLGTLFLTSFDLAREDKPNASSSRRGIADWEQRMYAHPSRHEPGTPYTMAHDIYSLGVNLLEIAMWQSLVTYDSAVQDLAFANDVIPGGRAVCEDGRAEAGERLRRLYLNAAVTALPVVAGNRFRDVVIFCLEVLDEGARDAGVQVAGQTEEETIGLRYIDQVLAKLDNIRV